MKDGGLAYFVCVALSCIILMLASVACTGWFFYSWLGGIPGIVGACVGCAIQIMAYGFSGVLVRREGTILRSVMSLLIVSTLGLSVLSSFATLSGYFSALEKEQQTKVENAEKKDRAISAALEQRVRLLESLSRDVEISSDAADQGVNEKYRTQAKQFLATNSENRKEIAAQIKEVEALIESDILERAPEEKKSPIDGLSKVLGGQSTAIMILCAWLAIMFDALPIVGIALLETRATFRRASETSVEGELERASTFLALGARASTLLNARKPSTVNLPLTEGQNDGPGDNTGAFRIFTNICSDDLALTKLFFTELLDASVKYETDWYIQLSGPGGSNTEFGVIRRNHGLVPEAYQYSPNGMYMTFMVPNVDEIYDRALAMEVDIIQEPRNEFYGQRRFLAREPGGCLIDISSPWESEDFEPEEFEDTASGSRVSPSDREELAV